MLFMNNRKRKKRREGEIKKLGDRAAERKDVGRRKKIV